MSTVLENLTDETDALTYSPSEMKRRRPSGKKVYKPQVSTKIKWALEDAMERAEAAQRRMQRIWERLDVLQSMSPADREVLVQVGKLEHELYGLSLDVAELERIVTLGIAESRPEGTRAKTEQVKSK